MENNATKLPDFKQIIDAEIARMQANPPTREESRALNKAFFSETNRQKIVCGLMMKVTQTFGTMISESTFGVEEELLETVCSRGISGGLMDFAYLFYSFGKTVGESQGLENMFKTESSVN